MKTNIQWFVMRWIEMWKERKEKQAKEQEDMEALLAYNLLRNQTRRRAIVCAGVATLIIENVISIEETKLAATLIMATARLKAMFFLFQSEESAKKEEEEKLEQEREIERENADLDRKIVETLGPILKRNPTADLSEYEATFKIKIIRVDFIDSEEDISIEESKLTPSKEIPHIVTDVPEHPAIDQRRVFVVHGRNMEARDAIFTFLRAINLDPIEWEEAIAFTNETAPYIGSALDIAFSRAQAAVVLLTGDDQARLGRRYLTPSDPPEERSLTPQARANVLFEAGMAFGKYPERTLLVTFGHTRPFSDIAGRHTVNVKDDVASRQRIADRLKTAKCDVRTDFKADWHKAGNFAAVHYDADIPVGPNSFHLKVTKRWATFDAATTHKYKIWLHIKNGSHECIRISHLGWRPEGGGIKAKIVSATLQLRLGSAWCPEKQGVEELHVPHGESVQTWIVPAPEYDLPTLDQHCEAEGTIGTLRLSVNGIETELPV